MQAANFIINDYLKRIQFTGSLTATPECIAKVMQQQLLHIPFENLDVQAGKIVSMEPEHIVDKILHHKRGGYCYELNALFSMMLTELGITNHFCAARPMFYPVRRPKTHMVILFQLAGETWLADLGFGSYGIRAPIKLSDTEKIIEQDFDQFKLVTSEREQGYILQAKVQSEWVSQFAFADVAQEWIDFAPVNYLNSTHPDTIFVKSLLVIKYTPEGRHILLDNKLKTIERGAVTETLLKTDEIAHCLNQIFNLDPIIDDTKEV